MIEAIIDLIEKRQANTFNVRNRKLVVLGMLRAQFVNARKREFLRLVSLRASRTRGRLTKSLFLHSGIFISGKKERHEGGWAPKFDLSSNAL